MRAGRQPITVTAVYGLVLALVSALLFGAATPLGKLLLGTLPPLQLAGLLYLGAALGVAPGVLWRRAPRPRLDARNRARLAGVVLLGGIVAPALFFVGLRRAAAGSVSLLLNLEVAATAVVAVGLFGEMLGPRGWLGVVGTMVAGALVSSTGGWPGAASAALVAVACVCWGFDNNLTALIDGMRPAETTLWKAAVAGSANLLLGLALDPLTASLAAVATALAVGAVSYGASIALSIAAAQQQGAIRAQAVFAVAPFVGAGLSWVALGEPVEPAQLLGGAVFVAALVLLARDRHAHVHVHAPLRHVHSHRHDDGHHAHEHEGVAAAARHTHWHEHDPVVHAHPHHSDLHHRHGR